MTGLESELELIYASEINVRLETFWDGGWRVAVGDEMNGLHWYDGPVSDVAAILPALQSLIKEHYPESSYAKSLMA
jgi:hypothetical protein